MNRCRLTDESDTAIANTALPTIAIDLQASPASIIWIVTAYRLSVVAGILPLAALGDGRGHRTLFLAGLIDFTLGSFACGAARSIPTLIAARAVQGLGAAALMSANIALVRQMYPDHLLGRGLGINALVIALGVAGGPVVASLILSFASWHWLFLFNVPVGLLALGMAWRMLPARPAMLRRFDGRAALLCALTFALFLHGAGSLAQGGAPWIAVLETGLAAVLCLLSKT